MGFLAKLFGRRPLVVPAPEPVFVREPEPDFEEDWDWQIAYARHRAQPEPAVVRQPVMQAPVVRPPARHAAVHVAVHPSQPGTVIPVPMLPVASDPSLVRLRQDPRAGALPAPRHVRFARGTDRHDTQQVTTVKPVAPPPPPARSASRPPPLPPALRAGVRR
jgi:hypothetical protein